MRVFFIVFLVAGLVGCGGGGGGGSAPAAPGTVATATPPNAPVSITAGSASTVALGTIGGSGASITLPATASGSGTVAAQLFASQPATSPALQSSARLPRSIGTSNVQPLLFVTFTPSATISFATTPSFTFTLAPGLAVSPPAQAYVSLFDPGNSAAGWQNFLGPAVVSGLASTGVTLSFASSAKPVTFQANQTYVFVLLTTPTTLVVPVGGAATPGPAFAYMAPGTAGGSFQSALATTSTFGEIINISGDVVTDNNGTNPNLSQGNVSVRTGTSATTFATSTAHEVPQSGRFVSASASLPALSGDRFDDGAAESALIRFSQTAGRTSNRAALGFRRTQALGATVGSTFSFAVATNAIGTNGTSSISVPATLAAISTHGYIWVDNALSLNNTMLNTIGTDFDQAYASDVAHFGTPEYSNTSPEAQLTTTPCDTNGNPIANASPVPLIVPPPNGMHVVLVVAEPAHLGAGVGGYFSSTNYTTQAFANCLPGQPKSNEASMIVVGYATGNSSQFELQEDLVRGTAHEFQHLINFVNHTILSQTPQSEDRYINEGLSVLAQDFAVHAQFPQLTNDVDEAIQLVADFFVQPSKFSLTGFTGIEPNTSSFQYNCLGCYGQAYLFQRYLYDRFGGDAYTHAMESSNLVSLANLQHATGVPPTQAISDFAVALMASGRGVVSDPRYSFGNFNPYGTYTDQFGRSLTLGGPDVFSVAPGTTQSLAAYLGTFYYVQVQAAPGAGAGITVTDLNGNFALTSGLLQF